MRCYTYHCKQCSYTARRSGRFHREPMCPHGHGSLVRKVRRRERQSWEAPKTLPLPRPPIPWQLRRRKKVCATCGGPLRKMKTPKQGTRYYWEMLECSTYPEHHIFVREHLR